MKNKIKDLLVSLLVLSIMIVFSFLAYLLAFNYAEPSHKIESGLSALLVGCFVFEIVALLFYASK